MKKNQLLKIWLQLPVEDEKESAPEDMATITGVAKTKEYQFRIQVSPLDCTGCGVCADVCPSKEKSLVMEPLLDRKDKEIPRWDYLHGASFRPQRQRNSSLGLPTRRSGLQRRCAS